MDHDHHSHSSQFLKTLYFRASKLQKSAQAVLPKKLAYRPILFFSLAVLFSILAFRITTEDAQKNWLTQNPPPLTLWEEQLIKRGFKLVDHPEKIEQVLDSIPFSLHSTTQVLMTENSRMLVIFSPNDPLIYSLDPQAVSLAPQIHSLWESIGVGWDALGEFLSREIPQIQRHTQVNSFFKRTPVDPREIRY